MAYVVWRVFMKKYSRVRLGLRGSLVTPTGQKALTCDGESWKSKSEDEKLQDPENLKRTDDTRQSRSKRVKNYLKRCKSVLSSKSVSLDQSVSDSSPDIVEQQLDVLTNHSEINEINQVFENVQTAEDICDYTSKLQVANIIILKRPETATKDECSEAKSVDNKESCVISISEQQESSSLLNETQETKERSLDETESVPEERRNQQDRKDVVGLVDKYFGGLYENYPRSKDCLIRQARDLLVCEYRGCLQRFENEFCIQASKLLQHLKDNSKDECSPRGWPLSLGSSGIVVHLNPLDHSIVRNRDCYISLKSRSLPGLEVALTWRKDHELHSHTLAEFRNPLQNLDDIMCSNIRSASDLEISSYDDYDGTELPELLQNLLVSVERAIERVPLDDLTFPCPQCLEYLPLDPDEVVTSCSCQCSCRTAATAVVNKKDMSMQTSPMFEFAGSIPHIDSDAEDDKESIKSGSLSKRLEVTRPKRISDLPEKLLMSGINLPGTVDVDGRPIILCYAKHIARAGLNKYEIAKLLLYYSTIPTSETAEKGFSLLLVADNEDDMKVLQILDKSIYLIENNMKIAKYLIWRPEMTSTEEKSNTSRVQTVNISNGATMEKYIKTAQSPVSCGGAASHDQHEWVEFFKQVEPFLASCKATGRSLLSTLSKLRNEEVPNQITRRYLNHQCRQISKALQMNCLQKIQREGPKTLVNLNKRAATIKSSADVQRKCAFAHSSFSAVDKVARRLEELENERRERLKELAKLRVFQTEISELASWTRKVADETLNSLVLLLRSATNSSAVKEISHDFEKFFFNAWRQIEKSKDLAKECKNIDEAKGEDVKELVDNLQVQMKAFKERLEDTRIHLENSSRCYLLLESCHDILEDDNKEQEEFVKLALQSGNNKLQDICKDITVQKENSEDHDKYQIERDKTATPLQPVTSTPVRLPNAQIRRRSISSHAYIYHCSHHAAGEACSCEESDNESTSVSYKLKKKYLQTFQNSCSCSSGTKDVLERKNSAALDEIKEERESVDDLLSSHNDCRRCDSGVSTGDNSIGEEGGEYNKKKLQRTCSCQYCWESCILCSGHSSSNGSSQDHTESQQDSILEDGSHFVKSNSSDDIEDETYPEEKRTVSPISSNKHLYCHSSNLDLPSDALYCNMDPKTQKTLTYIIKEMIETERDYVKSLDYVIVNYMPEISREDIPQVLRGQRNIVFGNIEKIFEFHNQHFLCELESCENNPLLVGQMFLKHDKKFYLYALYNKNKPKSDSLMSEFGTQFFKSKQMELGDKMDLASYLLKPVQRMGKYALLLQQMMKACRPEFLNSADRVVQEYEDLKLAEEMVRFQLRHGNDLLAMDSIRECDVNLKEQGRLIRQNEFLVWEGRSGKKSLRQVFLFEELILFSKAKRFPDHKNLDLYYYKNSIKMSDIGLTPKVTDSTTKFEIWFRKRKPNDTFTLQSMSQDVKKAWTEELSQILWKQAIRNRAVRMAEMSSMGIGNKPCLDIKPSADQISHRSISFAQLSKSAPRFRNSISAPSTEYRTVTKRPHSVISMSSSVSSGSTSSGASGSGPIGPTLSINLSCESSCESPKSCHRSATLNSQCSVESGIIADMSIASEECAETVPHGV